LARLGLLALAVAVCVRLLWAGQRPPGWRYASASLPG
jgi:hypothetical protein